MKKNFLLLLAVPAALCAQTTINGSRIIKGSLDASGSTRSLPNRTGTGSPGGRDTCATPGETYFQTDTTPGQNLWVCTAAGTPGTWNQISGSGGSSGASVVTGTSSPSGSCSAGSFYLRTDIQELYVCSGTNVWELASYASGNTESRPVGCVSGQLYVATDTGDLWYCAVAGSLGTWQSVTPLTNVTLNGAPQGAFSTLNLVNPPGANWTLTPNGQTLSISPTPDTTYLLSQTAAQTGAPFLCAPASNNSSAYNCSLTPTPAAMSNGMLVEFRPDVSCAGGPTTLNINGLGAKPIYSLDGSSNPAANDCRANRPTWLAYSAALNSGTGAFVLQSAANLPISGGNAAVTQTTIPYSSSVTFSRTTNIQEFILNLSGNVTSSTTSGFTAGDIYYFEICQNSTGGYTLAWPASGFPQAPTVDLTPNVCTKFHGTWDTSGTLQIAGVPTTSENPFLISQAHERSAPATPASSFEALWPDSGRNTWTGINSAGNTHIMPRSTHSGADQLYSNDLADYATMAAAALQSPPSTCMTGYAPNGVDVHGNALNCTQISGGGGMVYPGAGVPNSTGSAWGTSYQVGAGANDLVQLNSSGALPAASGANLTNLPAATALNLSSTPAQCPAGEASTGISQTGAASGCFTPSGGSGGGSPGGSNNQVQYNNGGSLGGFTVGGDATLNVSTGALTVTKTNGTAFAPSAITDTTNASNISSGILSASRLPSTAMQTNQSNTVTAGTQNFSGAAHTLPTVVGSGAPSGNCMQGELYFDAAATAGQNLYFCTATNIWTQMTGGGSSSTVTDSLWIPFAGQSGTSTTAIAGPGISNQTGNSSNTSPSVSIARGAGYSQPVYEFYNDAAVDYIFIPVMLPSTWASSGGVTFTLLAMQGSATGSAYFTVAASCPTVNSTAFNAALPYNTSSAGYINEPTAEAFKLAYLNPTTTSGTGASTFTLNTSGCSAGNLMVIRVGRDDTTTTGLDTMAGPIYVVGMQLQWQHN